MGRTWIPAMGRPAGPHLREATVPIIRTTFEPWKTTEVDAAELANLGAMGVIAEVLPDEPAASPRPAFQPSRAAVTTPAEG